MLLYTASFLQARLETIFQKINLSFRHYLIMKDKNQNVIMLILVELQQRD